MVNLVIAGLPKNVKMPKFISFLENTIFKSTINAQLISTEYVEGTFKNVTLRLKSNDARRVRRYLNGLGYNYAGQVFPLKCWTIEAKNKPLIQMDSDGEVMVSHSLDSENPIALKNELETINLKIELIKKKRMLVEEENRLLLEQKKLEMMNNIGPNDYENLAKFDKVFGRNSPIDAPLSQPSTSNAKKRYNTRLPSFNEPFKIILSEMKQDLVEYDQSDNHDLIRSLLNATIRKRLVIIVQGKDNLSAMDIALLYREQYPQSSDKKLLQDLMNTIIQSCLPENDPEQAKTETVGIQIKTENAEVCDTILKEPIEVKKENGDVKIIDGTETKNDTENISKEGEVDVSLSEKTLENLEDGDNFVDMDNDYEDWVSSSKTDLKSEDLKVIEDQKEVIDQADVDKIHVVDDS